jgi:hypothetical protein
VGGSHPKFTGTGARLVGTNGPATRSTGLSHSGSSANCSGAVECTRPRPDETGRSSERGLMGHRPSAPCRCLSSGTRARVGRHFRPRSTNENRLTRLRETDASQFRKTPPLRGCRDLEDRVHRYSGVSDGCRGHRRRSLGIPGLAPRSGSVVPPPSSAASAPVWAAAAHVLTRYLVAAMSA